MTEAQAPATKQFKCNQCGAKVQFAPGTEVMKCPYCEAEVRIPSSEEEIVELDFVAFLRDAEQGEETHEQRVVRCAQCAAQFELPPNITSTECPFCGSNVVQEGASRKTLKPKSLLPFKIDQRGAWERFRGWIKSLWFAPGDLKRYAQTEGKLNGMYVPYWTYDFDATSFYRGERGDDYWVTESYTTTENGKTVRKTRQVRKTRWHSVSGTVWNTFDDLLVLASQSLPRKHTEALEPWDLNNLVPYGDEFLSGFRTEQYTVDLAQGFERAKDIADDAIRATIRRDIGGDHQRIHSVRSRYDEITFKHLLLPVWISAYRYRKKVYRFLINARTGEVQGERPWSWIKITLAVLGIAAVVAVCIILGNR